IRRSPRRGRPLRRRPRARPGPRGPPAPRGPPGPPEPHGARAPPARVGTPARRRRRPRASAPRGSASEQTPPLLHVADRVLQGDLVVDRALADVLDLGDGLLADLALVDVVTAQHLDGLLVEVLVVGEDIVDVGR